MRKCKSELTPSHCPSRGVVMGEQRIRSCHATSGAETSRCGLYKQRHFPGSWSSWEVSNKAWPQKIPVVASFLLVKWDAISGAEEPKNYHHTGASEIPSSRGRTRTAGQVTALWGMSGRELSPVLEAFLFLFTCQQVVKAGQRILDEIQASPSEVKRERE